LSLLAVQIWPWVLRNFGENRIGLRYYYVLGQDTSFSLRPILDHGHDHIVSDYICQRTVLLFSVFILIILFKYFDTLTARQAPSTEGTLQIE
jgi:hypothetical protein